MTPAGIEPATFRFVAQRLNHCATVVPTFSVTSCIIFRICWQFSTLLVYSNWLGMSLSNCFDLSSRQQKNADWLEFVLTDYSV